MNECINQSINQSINQFNKYMLWKNFKHTTKNLVSRSWTLV